MDEKWPEQIEAFEASGGQRGVSQGQVASLLASAWGEDPANMATNVSRWMGWWVENRREEAKADGWERPERAVVALNDFRLFRETYFKVARGKYKGRAPVTAPFHMEWIEAMLAAIPVESGGTGEEGVGGQLMILSPPRHGKSLLVTHFILWLIVRNPDIVIIWIGGNEKIAKRSGNLIRQELERNELLREDFCGPGKQFRPENRSGLSWTAEELHVATRTIPQLAPTLTAVGRGGAILSMDADVMIVDDLESQKTTKSPTMREETKEYFDTDVASRNEEHTAWIVIGSRQHVEDNAGRLIEMDDWVKLISSAHAPDCSKPPDSPSAHQDCVLWPEMRTYRYLLTQKRQVGQRVFNLQYLNAPDADSSVVFSRADVEACFNHSRRLRDVSAIPGVVRLIAGLDPAAAGMQAAVLWAVDKRGKMWLLDMENEKAGSIPHLLSVMRRWKTDYGLSEWVYEANSNNLAWLSSPEIVKLQRELRITIHSHQTGMNKHEGAYSLTSMAAWFEDPCGGHCADRDPDAPSICVGRRIDLAYGDEETRVLVDVYAHQLRNYTTNWTSKSSALTDVLMAGWFPFERIKRMTLKKRRHQSSFVDRRGRFTPDAYHSNMQVR